MKPRNQKHLLPSLAGLLVCVAWCMGGPPARGEEEREWREDPNRVERYWKTSLSAEEYARALRATGQDMTAGPRAGTPVSAWYSVGPIGDFNVRDYNGRITGIHIRDHGTYHDVYVGACSGGLWQAHSDDGTGVWSSIGDGLPNPSVRAFAVHPTNPDVIIVGTGDWRRYTGGGMFRSTDGGATWTEISLPVTADAFFRIHFLPTDPDIVVAASDGGLLRSTDGGLTWTQRVAGVATDVVLHPTNPNIQYTCVMRPGTTSGRGIYKSTNGGSTWTFLSDATLPSGYSWDRASLAICRDQPGNLAVIVENDNYLQGVYKSTDSGASWTDITGTLAGFGGNQIFHAQAIAFRPNNSDEIFVGGVSIAHTTDGGSTWTTGGDTGIEIGHADITQLHFSSVTGNNVLWVCNDGGIYRHVLGGSTTSWNGNSTTGLKCSQIDYFDAASVMRVIGLQDNGIVRTINGGSSWDSVDEGDGFGVRITDDLAWELWYANGIWSPPPGVRIYKQPYGGARVNTNNTDEHNVSLFWDWYSDRMFSTGDDHLTSVPVAGPYTWDVELSLAAADNDREVFGDRLRTNTVYVSFWSGAKLAFCRDTGSGWSTNLHTLSTNPDAHVQTVFASTRRPGECWAGLSGPAGTPRILHTTDDWANWEDLTGTLSSVGMVEAIVVTPFDDRQIFVGTDLGVFWSRDGGATWSPFQTGLPIVRCTGLAYFADPGAGVYNRLLVATYGRGVWERQLTGYAITYVDAGAGGAELGTFEHPYNTFDEGVDTVTPGGLLGVRGGTYSISTPMLLDTPMLMDSWDPPAIIGQ